MSQRKLLIFLILGTVITHGALSIGLPLMNPRVADSPSTVGEWCDVAHHHTCDVEEVVSGVYEVNLEALDADRAIHAIQAYQNLSGWVLQSFRLSKASNNEQLTLTVALAKK